MKTIVRIEHPSDGKGIWMSRDNKNINYVDTLSNYLQFAERHCKFPNPVMENLSFKEGVNFCAFKTVEQMTEWVKPSEIKELMSMGFKVLAIDVSEWLEGEYQICFEKRHILQTKDISSLFE